MEFEHSYLGKLRKQVGSQKLIAPGAMALLVNEKEEVLLQKRRDFDLWGLPGGLMELEESVEETLIRELHEETMLTPVEYRPVGLYTGAGSCVTFPNGDQLQNFTVVFLCTKWSGTLANDDAESKELRFFPMNRLPVKMVDWHRGVVEDYATMNGRFVLK
ncbi:MAG: NUDIX hydrolase [Clostridia bacterium]